MASTDPLLCEDPQRLALFPVRFHKLWQRYKACQVSLWTIDDIDLSLDRADWIGGLTDDERTMLSTVLVLLVCSDGSTTNNSALRLHADVRAPEARFFFEMQMVVENVHVEVYARLTQELIDDESKLVDLFHTISTTTVLKDKTAWLLKWSDSASYSFTTRVVALAIVKGIFLSSSIAAVFWVRSRGILPGLCQSLALIMRDVRRHMDFACEVYRTLEDELSVGMVHSMVRDAVVLERNVFRMAVPQALRGLNSRLMDEYVGYVADVMLRRLGFPALYDVANPFHFMENVPIIAPNNIFESAVFDCCGTLVGHV